MQIVTLANETISSSQQLNNETNSLLNNNKELNEYLQNISQEMDKISSVSKELSSQSQKIEAKINENISANYYNPNGIFENKE